MPGDNPCGEFGPGGALCRQPKGHAGPHKGVHLEWGATDDCECCNGHVDGCDALEPAWDIGDLLCRSPCSGCCPNGCRPEGMQRLQDDAARRTRRFFGIGGEPPAGAASGD